MSDRPWWVTVLQWTAWAVIMALVMGALNRGRLRPGRSTDAALRYPMSMWIVAFLGFAFFGTCTVLSAMANRELALLLAAIALPNGLLLLDCFMSKHELTESGLRFRRLSGKRGFIEWQQVREVRYRQGLTWFQVKSASGDLVRLSAGLAGLPEFAIAVLRSVPREAINEETRAILEETAARRPPVM